jgi:hypothetical protein
MARALPCQQFLPCRALPCRALQLIREYSKPRTKPEWRNSVPIITTYGMYKLFKKMQMSRIKIKPKYIALFKNIENTEWYYAYKTINDYGMQRYYTNYIYKPGVKYNPNDDSSPLKRLYSLIYNCM